MLEEESSTKIQNLNNFPLKTVNKWIKGEFQIKRLNNSDDNELPSPRIIVSRKTQTKRELIKKILSLFTTLQNIHKKFYTIEPSKKKDFLQKYEMLHEDTESHSFVTRHFLMFDLYRQLIWCLIVAVFNAPLTQMILICLVHLM